MNSSLFKSSSFALTLVATAAAGLVGYVAYQKLIKAQQDAGKDPISRIFQTKDDMAKELCAFVVEEAKKAIAQRDVFYLAVAGGSLLDSLAKLKDDYKDALDWSKVVLVFANHKCVAPDSDAATLAKCKSKFATALGITQFVSPCSVVTSGSDGTAEAKFYAKALIKANVPHKGVYPILDLVLLGLGADGHVGSCHPMGPAVANKTEAVAGSPKSGEPSSITLTIESMNMARQLCVVVTGGSDGKKEAVKRALKRPAESPRGIFPAQLLDGPVFFLDSEAAAEL